jgi:D-alanyl-lipoteichoic acid acyltransferase DltB (MBOAT superfamily)
MDFSGYTDMALGSARLFNVNLTQNFNSPYLATSVADFWRRWHISFSRWILDYIFKPLQMHWRNWEKWGIAAALMITFLVSGLWHGVKWGFVIWGGLHGLYLACSLFYMPYQKKLHKSIAVEKTMFLKAWQIFVTFNLVCLAWVFFRAEKVADALYTLSSLSRFPLDGTTILQVPETRSLLIGMILVAVATAASVWDPGTITGDRFRSLPLKVRWATYYILTAAILWSSGRSGQFIYFQF